MKFRMANLGYRNTPDYPYDYRIELLEHDFDELKALNDWLRDNNVKHTLAGWNPGSVIYLQEADAIIFRLTWS